MSKHAILLYPPQGLGYFRAFVDTILVLISRIGKESLTRFVG